MRRMSIVLTIIGASTLLASGVALAATVNCNANPCLGTFDADVIFGTDGDDTIDGRGGNDTMYGGLGNDTMEGSDDNDTVHGEGGNDTFTGGSGSDIVYGGPGRDVFQFREGQGVSVDRVVGGRGNDYIQIANRPASKDVARCGAGRRDRVVADTKDKVYRAGCEKVLRIK